MPARFLLFVLLIVLSKHVGAQTAQTANYVEVSVNDTVMIKVDYFVIRISVMPDNLFIPPDTAGIRTDPNYYLRVEERRRARQLEMQKNIEARLKRIGLHVEPTTMNDFVYRGNGMSQFTVTTHSFAVMDSLNMVFKTERSVSGTLMQIGSSEEEPQSARLLKKLIAKARERASKVAAISGKKITGLLSVTDRKTDFNYTSGLFTLQGSTIDREGFSNQYPMTGNIQIRFSWQ